jgi:hypothetical protein
VIGLIQCVPIPIKYITYTSLRTIVKFLLNIVRIYSSPREIVERRQMQETVSTG